jgi:hypothetical protein
MKHTGIILPATLVLLAGYAVGGCGGKESAPVPTADCMPKDPSCPALAVSSDCLALVDNKDKEIFAMRMSQLSVEIPEALTGPAVYKIVADGVNINLPSCNLHGLGTFSWLTVFDPSGGTLRTGGALPMEDPSDGYCFDHDAAHNISPVEIATTYGADGRFDSDAIPALTVPIYLDVDAESAVYLPLHQVRLTGGSISPDNNCVGSFNAKGLEPINSCKPDLSAGIEYFINGANIEGHIVLEEADEVIVDTIGQTLCVLLSGNASKYGKPADDGPMKCKRDPASNEIVLQGDWCSTSDSPGGCKDAFRLEAGMAASAVAVRDDCTGGTSGAGGAGGAGGG